MTFIYDYNYNGLPGSMEAQPVNFGPTWPESQESPGKLGLVQKQKPKLDLHSN